MNEEAIFFPRDPDEPIRKDDLATQVGLNPGEWPLFRKTVPVNAIRVSGQFAVVTSEGVLTCTDGWLAIDARGYPYPIADDEFQLIYEPLEPDVGPLTKTQLIETAYRQLEKLCREGDPAMRVTAAKVILDFTQERD